jgi:para-aminobenzoate synthetase/4-amino-4-deoxychorismate lyase
MALAYRPEEVMPTLERLERLVNTEHLTAAGFVSYEAASGFDAALSTQDETQLPLVCFGLFAEVTECKPPVASATPGTPSWQLDTEHHEYLADIAEIRDLIAAGEVYQINHTVRLHNSVADPWQHFCHIAADAPYAAFIETDEFAVASASPELFFRLQGNDLQSRPMKGTESRRTNPQADKQTSDWLAGSQKNRAENLMITDMVRNDLGKIAVAGSVDVSGLFKVEEYPTVWQMTSTVHAQTKASVVEIFRTLFPAASITGAPKRAAMGHIARLEKTPRGIYTGAIGYLAPNRHAQFSIAIRTSAVNKSAGTAQYGAGGGIVWDSTAVQEHTEMLAKTRILGVVTSQASIELFETLLWTPGVGFSRLERHLWRLGQSAQFFGIPMDAENARSALDLALAGAFERAMRVRLSLNVQGEFRVELNELPEASSFQQVQPIRLATNAVDSSDLYLKHKTSYRTGYDQAAAEVPDGIEPILFNERGEITESNIANVVYRLGSDWFTPPVSCGLLPGTLREELLELGKLTPRVLHIAELESVQELALINGLRGWRQAGWV